MQLQKIITCQANVTQTHLYYEYKQEDDLWNYNQIQ